MIRSLSMRSASARKLVGMRWRSAAGATCRMSAQETWTRSFSKALALAASNRGDLDGSGRVDIADLVRLALAFGARNGEEHFDAEADINGDGIVDGFDLNILSEFFGLEVAAP